MNSPLLPLILLGLASGVLSQIRLQESGPGAVKPGETLTLTCSVTGGTVTSTYYWTWIRQAPGQGLEWMGVWSGSSFIKYNPSLQDRTTITVDSSSTKYYLRLSALTTADTATYFCARGHYGIDYWGQGTMVTVTSASPTAPSVFPLTSCAREASQVTIGCLVQGYFPEPVTMQWRPDTKGVKNYPSVLQTSTGLYSLSSQVTVPASNWQSNTYYCNVEHQPTGSSISKEIPKPSKPLSPAVEGEFPCPTGDISVFIVPPSPSELASGRSKLTCLVINLPNTDKLSVIWTQNKLGGNIAYPLALEPQCNRTYTASSSLPITRKDWEDRITYTCTVKHWDQTITNSISKQQGSSPSVYLLPPAAEDLSRNRNSVSLTCLVLGFSPDNVEVNWKESSHFVTTSPVKDDNSKYLVYSMLTVDYNSWNRGDIYTCEVNHVALTSPISKQIHKGSAEATSLSPPCPPTEVIVYGEYCTEDGDEEIDSLWSTISVFITLFLVSVCYSATVTLFKVKWLFATVVQLKQETGPEYKNVMQRVV